MEVVVRAYDDGAAFRYRPAGTGNYRVAQELTEFRLPGQPNAWAQPWRRNYESLYGPHSAAALATGDWGWPVLLEQPGKCWALLAEANVHASYAVLHPKGGAPSPSSQPQAASAPGLTGTVLGLTFPPDQRGSITGPFPLETPWRMVIVAPKLAGIVESDLVQNLNPPSKLEDTSWIKPGRAAWSWWSSHRSRAAWTRRKSSSTWRTR